VPEIEITDECLALIESSAEPLPRDGRRLSNENWRVPIETNTLQRLQEVRLKGETISDCIIRVVIITLHKRGLL
jgi:hypothetical protein